MANYINNREFHDCLVKHKERSDAADAAGKQRPRLPNYFGEAVTNIATKYATKPSFSGYSYKDEMISDAIMACIQYADRYDTTRPERLQQPPNPLAYFTQIVHFAFLTRLHSEHKQQYIKALTLRSNPNIIETDEDNFDSFDDVITKFERKLKIKKEKAAERKAIRESEQEQTESIVDE